MTHLLVGALDTHLGFHTDHSKNVARLSVSLGRELGLDDERLERLHFAALLHDIGMLEINLDMLGDPRAMRNHPDIGAAQSKRSRRHSRSPKASPCCRWWRKMCCIMRCASASSWSHPRAHTR